MSTNEDYLSDEACSVSRYMPDTPSKIPRRKETRKVKLVRQQYECLMKLTKQPRFSGSPFYWKLRSAPTSWKALTATPGNYFVWGVCWWWLGPLKFGMVAETFDGAEELYSILMECSSLMDRKKKVADSPHEYHPYTFLKFSHVSDGVFEVCWSGSRVTGKEGSKTSVIVTGQKGLYQRHLTTECKFSLRLQRLDNEASQCTRLSQVDGVPKMTPLGQKTNLKIEQMFLKELDRPCQSGHDADEEWVNQLEGVHSLCFRKEVERSFASISRQLKDQGETIDLDHLERVMYSSTDHTARDNWTLNSSTFTDIGSSLEQFIRERGEELLQKSKECLV